ncbi:hypothetical protein [Rhodobaculum claviforme]|uniref:PA14 domain-containing protein n=1 Tax=Rhodobaculum claviforme TaxID=1549854 RepID=A0A934TJK1_9RHOB|nr:hypothetical protein [Rhodobaculum claviforme]MBK5926992.1 hypothetical protein [Rhodobaculum claviforme]
MQIPRPAAARPGAAALAGLLMLAAPPIQAQQLVPGLKGEVWFGVDLYSNDALFFGDGLGALGTSQRTGENILPRAETAIASRPADGTFVSTALNYPQDADTIKSSRAPATEIGGLEDFLGTDHATFTLRDGVTEPARPLEFSLWRFTGVMQLTPGVTYEFRIRSDDGNATWLGFDPATDPVFPTVAPNSFRASGTFDPTDPDVVCCRYRVTAEGDGLMPFKMLFYERQYDIGMRMQAATEQEGDAFVTFSVVGGEMLRHDAPVGVIPVPAAAGLLVSGLMALALVGVRRRRSAPPR